jgi:acetylornithine deacetylase/succinyl-diaminopimelate desuccinylase family protein
LELLDRDAIIGFAQELVRIPSENPPGHEKAVALKILEKLNNLGLTTRIIEAEKGRPNIVATLEGDQDHPALLFNGHTDVVPAGPDWDMDPFSGTIKDHKLYGRGSCDMKGGLAAMLAVAEAFVRTGIKPLGKLTFAVVVDEETGGNKGTGYLVENHEIQADMAIVAEPSDFRMSISEGGVLWSELCVRGKRAHTINRRDAVNAVEKMAGVITALTKLSDELSRFQHESYGSPILSVNMVNGGIKVNIVPDDCRASLDFRFPPGIGMDIDQAISKIEDLLEEMKQRDQTLQVEIQHKIVAQPFEQSEDIEIVRRLKESYKQVTGQMPEWWRRGKKTVIPTDDSDCYHLWVKENIPCVYFGPGKLEWCHAANEHIDTKDIYKAAKIYTMLALNTLTTLPD